MATDVESPAKPADLAPTRPSLKITGLHIRNLKSIEALDLPADGLGWDGPIPDMLMIGGINGSGKTTLLELLATAFGLLFHTQPSRGGIESARRFSDVEARVEFHICFEDHVDATVRVVIGDRDFVADHCGDDGIGYVAKGSHLGEGGISGIDPALVIGGSTKLLLQKLFESDSHALRDFPSVVYFPSERRTLVVIEESYKLPGKDIPHGEFVQRWTPPEKWKDTLEARLYSLRWEDLNDKEEGRPAEATRFDSYARAFNRFFDGQKQIKWHRAELVVQTKAGAIHGLDGLSSGEKQVILFMGELLHRWRPGSLILIDEPELHLHEIFQSKLWDALVQWREERGGQVIVATQSDYLFRFSDPGIKVLLNRRRSR